MASKRKEVKENVFFIDWDILDSLNFDQAIEYFQDVKEKVCFENNDFLNFYLEIDMDTESWCFNGYQVVGVRYETDKEYNKRIKQKKKSRERKKVKKIDREEQEYQEYLKLKKKFEGE